MTDPTEKPKWLAVRTTDPKPTAVWLTKRVEAMLSLYFQPLISDDTDLLAATIWIDVLGDIPQQAIEQACREWEREQEKRPTPAGIRRRALARIARPDAPKQDKPFAGPPPKADELQRRREIALEMGMDKYAPSAEIIEFTRRSEVAGPRRD